VNSIHLLESHDGAGTEVAEEAAYDAGWVGQVHQDPATDHRVEVHR
jgi:hypothetical protein